MSSDGGRSIGAGGARVEVLWPDGTLAVGDGLEARACASIDALRDEAAGVAELIPYRDAAAREGQARAVAADRTLDAEERRRLIEHVADTAVVELAPVAWTTLVQFVDPPDWELLDALGDDFWSDDGKPSPILCVASLRTDDGGVIDCCGAAFASVQERDAAAVRFASDERLTSEQRRTLVSRISRTPIDQIV
jgi:hypothetical protein